MVLARGLNPRVQLTPLDRPFVVVPAQGEWMIALISHGALGPWTSERLSHCTLYVAPRDGLSDPASCPWTRVAGVEDGVTAFAADQDTLYLVSYRDAPRSPRARGPVRRPGPLPGPGSWCPPGPTPWRRCRSPVTTCWSATSTAASGGCGGCRWPGASSKTSRWPSRAASWSGPATRTVPRSCCWLPAGPTRRGSTATTGTPRRWRTPAWRPGRRSTTATWTLGRSRSRPGTAP